LKLRGTKRGGIIKPNKFVGLLFGRLAYTPCLVNPLLLEKSLFERLDAEEEKLAAITILNIMMKVVKSAAGI
jgi:hypothetical protein